MDFLWDIWKNDARKSIEGGRRILFQKWVLIDLYDLQKQSTMNMLSGSFSQNRHFQRQMKNVIRHVYSKFFIWSGTAQNDFNVGSLILPHLAFDGIDLILHGINLGACVTFGFDGPSNCRFGLSGEYLIIPSHLLQLFKDKCSTNRSNYNCPEGKPIRLFGDSESLLFKRCKLITLSNFYKKFSGLFWLLLAGFAAWLAASFINGSFGRRVSDTTGGLLGAFLTIMAGILFYHRLLALNLL